MKFTGALKDDDGFLGCLSHITNVGQWSSDSLYRDAIPFDEWQTIIASGTNSAQFQSGGFSGNEMTWNIDYFAFKALGSILVGSKA